MHSIPRAAPTHLAATILIILISISISIAHARILNVPDDFETIQGGIDAAQRGDTVLIAPGVYEENVVVQNGHFLIASRYLLEEDPDNIVSTIIDGSQNGAVVTWMRGYAQLCGLTIRNGISATGGGGLSIGTRAHLRNMVINSNSADEDGGGINFYNSNDYVVEDSEIRNNSSGRTGGGIAAIGSLRMTRVLVADNNAAGNFGAIDWHNMEQSVALFDRITVVNNSTDNGDCGGAVLNYAIDGDGGSAIINSIFWHNGDRNLNLRFTFEQLLDYNDFNGGLESISHDGEDRIRWRNSNIDSDPLFLDPDNGDYSLSADSPCIDAGAPDSPLDPDGTRADMGAFYFHQRDINVEPLHIEFPPTPWDSISAIPVIITNTGGNDLHLTDVLRPMHASFIVFDWDWSPDDPVTILPDSSLTTWAIFYPQREGEGQAMPRTSWVIVCDDPDEPEVSVDASGEILSVPSDNLHSAFFTLHSSFPNPFNSSTTIRFSLPGFGEAGLRVFDLSGREVASLLDAQGLRHSGTQELVWNAEGLPGGVYLIRLESGGESRTAKAILLR